MRAFASQYRSQPNLMPVYERVHVGWGSKLSKTIQEDRSVKNAAASVLIVQADAVAQSPFLRGVIKSDRIRVGLKAQRTYDRRCSGRSRPRKANLRHHFWPHPPLNLRVA